VSVLGDALSENLELFQVKLTSAQNGKFSAQTDQYATGIIQDNDQPQISISDAKITEGNRDKKNMKFEVKLNSASNQTVKVNYETIDGSAKSGKDYEKKSGVVIFKPGQTRKTINISTLGDTLSENLELFQVKLSGAQNGEFSAQTDQYATAIIQDNDKLPEISISDAFLTEGNTEKKEMEFEVKLDKSSTQTVKVNYETVEGSAKLGKDFQKKRGVVIFKPGETKKTVNVPILGDTDNEANEKFEVTLSSPKNAKLSDGKGVGTIQDNDREAIDLGVLSEKPILKSDKIGFTTGGANRDTEDYFRFEVEKEGLVSIFMDGFVQNIGMELYDQDDSLLFRSNVDDLGIEVINKTLDPGIYYLRVFPVGSNRTTYNLSINIVER
ncbi:sodium:calcium exchanger, partial [Trichodesmium erythraeum 21-75]|nr:sodium:calcium exchanger [Trichodesmium erythraeum 21-75]